MFEYRHDRLQEARERNCRAREIVLRTSPLTVIRLPIGEAVAPLDECGISLYEAVHAIAILHDGADITTIADAITARPTVGAVLANRRYRRTDWPLATSADDQED